MPWGGAIPSASVLAVRADGTVEPVKREVSPPSPPAPQTQARFLWLPKPEPWHVVVGVLVLTLVAIVVTMVIFRLQASRREPFSVNE